MARTILVTGATGTVGSEVLRLLAGQPGIEVRAAIRNLNKSAAVAGPGVETVFFDYGKPETFAVACQGVDTMFLVAPFSPNGVEEAIGLIAAARVARVSHIVKLSVIQSVKDITMGRWHAAIDSALKNSGIAWTILYPSGFMQNFVENSPPGPDGAIYQPVGNAEISFIDIRDIAEVAAKALVEPGHEGREYTLTGPEDISYAQAAAMMSEASGRPIRFVDVPEAAARAAMLGAHMPEWLVSALLELNARMRNNQVSEITSTVQDVLGHPPRTFRQFARDYAVHWKG